MILVKIMSLNSPVIQSLESLGYLGSVFSSFGDADAATTNENFPGIPIGDVIKLMADWISNENDKTRKRQQRKYPEKFKKKCKKTADKNDKI